jgi:hypothetical protein
MKDSMAPVNIAPKSLAALKPIFASLAQGSAHSIGRALVIATLPWNSGRSNG